MQQYFPGLEDPAEMKRRRKAARNAIRKANATKIVRVLNLGAGVQSTALLLMDAQVHRLSNRDVVEDWLGQPYPFEPYDVAIFADTQDEPRAVYEHLARLMAMDTAPILTGTAGRLGNDLISGVDGRFASIPAFTAKVEGKNIGLIERQCTGSYKVAVVEQIIRREVFGLLPRRSIPRKFAVVQSFGLSSDEQSRIAKTKRRVDQLGWAIPHFPLDVLRLERPDCRAYLATLGVDVARSACVFCPFKTNIEWRDLRDNDPEGWARAVAVDEGMRSADARCSRGLDQKLYVHRSCVPLSRAPIDGPSLPSGFLHECEGMCGV